MVEEEGDGGGGMEGRVMEGRVMEGRVMERRVVEEEGDGGREKRRKGHQQGVVTYVPCRSICNQDQN